MSHRSAAPPPSISRAHSALALHPPSDYGLSRGSCEGAPPAGVAEGSWPSEGGLREVRTAGAPSGDSTAPALPIRLVAGTLRERSRAGGLLVARGGPPVGSSALGLPGTPAAGRPAETSCGGGLSAGRAAGGMTEARCCC